MGEEQGLRVERYFSRDRDPYDSVDWERRRALIQNDKGRVIFEQDDVEVPRDWSQLALNVVASKYFWGPKGTPKRENSVRNLVHRVARTITDYGKEKGYFTSPEDAENFYKELSFLCLNQYGSFNSPVWFNAGLFHVNRERAGKNKIFAWDEAQGRPIHPSDDYERPQASACFIQSVRDDMDDIMRLAGIEAMLFKYGSGTGTDLSTLRSSREKLSSGGSPSGPLSFMRIYDQIAAVIKSGGKTRRAAKMQSLKVDHPDIVEFIEAKAREEKKAWDLIEIGYDGNFEGEAYSSVVFQNCNLSVRVTDEFMNAVEQDGYFETRAVTTGEVVQRLKARELLRKIAEGAHICGDPGVQYDTTINDWHTCFNSGRINASNPCSEFMFLDNSACNLASLNLMKFLDEKGRFNAEGYEKAARCFTIAQDILVDLGGYPTEEIASNSHRFRPLGLGYSNLGAVCMLLGLPYDSDEARTFASAVTAHTTGTAYKTSQELARARGTFEEYEKNREPMGAVLRKHREHVERISSSLDRDHPGLSVRIKQLWEEIEREERAGAGFRNAQVTLLAPTGTIGFMMDCDTTGVEPEKALVIYKQLAGGGSMKLVNRTVGATLKRLGYDEMQRKAILRHVEEEDTIEGALELREEHLPIFDCAFKPKNGSRFIPYQAHLRMMAAIQPFLSGAISKTINMPHESNVEDILKAYMDGWRLGLKAIAVYRDGSKKTQPLALSLGEGEQDGHMFYVRQKGQMLRAIDLKRDKEVIRNLLSLGGLEKELLSSTPKRRKMPIDRPSITHKFDIAEHEGYLTTGLYEDGSPGEMFITMAKEGSTIGGVMDAFGTAISLCLQYGVPSPELSRKFAHSRFEPAGFTKNPELPNAKSIVDYIFRWMDITFPNGKMADWTPEVYRVLCRTAAKEKALNKITALAEQSMTAREEPEEELPPTSKRCKAVAVKAERTSSLNAAQSISEQAKGFQEDAPACDVCGSITERNGACYKCRNCGNSMGCS